MVQGIPKCSLVVKCSHVSGYARFMGLSLVSVPSSDHRYHFKKLKCSIRRRGLVGVKGLGYCTAMDIYFRKELEDKRE